jgi:hypothetical protein
MVTFRPRNLSSRPRDAAVSPLPSELETPPVTNTYFVSRFALVTEYQCTAGIRKI